MSKLIFVMYYKSMIRELGYLVYWSSLAELVSLETSEAVFSSKTGFHSSDNKIPVIYSNIRFTRVRVNLGSFFEVTLVV